MPKNKGKGGKNRRRGKNENDFVKRELVMKEPGQEYGQVNRMLGNGRVEVHCFDGKQRICHIRGKLRRRIWITTGDFILLGLRDFQDDKADVLQKYSSDEARRLKAAGELPENAKINENDDQDEGEIVFKELDNEGGEFESDHDDFMPTSGSDSDEDEDDQVENKSKKEADDDDEEEESTEESDDESENDSLNEEDLARGRGLEARGGREGRGGRGGRGGKRNKWGGAIRK